MDLKDWLRSQWDRVAAGLALGVGALALLLGWLGVRDAVFPGQQIPYVVSGGLVGLFLVGLGAALWLSADLRDEWRKLDDIDAKLDQLVSHGARAGGPGGAGTVPHDAGRARDTSGQSEVEQLRARLADLERQLDQQADRADERQHVGSHGANGASGTPERSPGRARRSGPRPLQTTT